MELTAPLVVTRSATSVADLRRATFTRVRWLVRVVPLTMMVARCRVDEQFLPAVPNWGERTGFEQLSSSPTRTM